MPAKGLLSRSSETPAAAIVRRECRWYSRRFLQSGEERVGGVERPLEMTAETVWSEVSDRLRDALNENTYSTWFADVEAAPLDGDEFALVAPNDFTREWIEGHFLGLIQAAVRDSVGEELPVRISVRETERPR